MMAAVEVVVVTSQYTFLSNLVHFFSYCRSLSLLTGTDINTNNSLNAFLFFFSCSGKLSGGIN